MPGCGCWSAGTCGRTAELRQQIDAGSAAELSSERDRLAWHWLQVHGLVDDGRYTQVGELLDEMLPDARRLGSPSR